LRPTQPAPGVHPDARALSAELPLRTARVERARRRTRVARRELAVARGLLGDLPGPRREILSPRGAREVRVSSRSAFEVSGGPQSKPLVDLALAPGPVGLA